MIDIRCTNRSCNAQFGPSYQGTICMHCGFRVETVQILAPGQSAGASNAQNLQNLLGQLAGAPGTQPLNLQPLSLGAPGTHPGNQNTGLSPPPGLQMSQSGNTQAQSIQTLLSLLQNQSQNVSTQFAPGTATPHGQPQGQGAYIKQEPGTTPYGQPNPGAPSSAYGTAFAPSLNSVPLQTATGSYNPPVQFGLGGGSSQTPPGFNFQPQTPGAFQLGGRFFQPLDASALAKAIGAQGNSKRQWPKKGKPAGKPLDLTAAEAAGLPPKPTGGSASGANSEPPGKRRKGNRKSKGAKTGESTSQRTPQSTDSWCFHCSCRGHWHDDCDRLDAESKAKVKDSYWTTFHVQDEMQNTPPVPTTYAQAMCFYHELYQHGVNITNHGYARDQVFPQVQAYMASKLDGDGLLAWQTMTAIANRDLNYLAMDIRRRATEFYNKGIHKPLAALMETDSMGIAKSSPPNEDGTVPWTRSETTQYLAQLGDNPINAQFKKESFDEMVRMLNDEYDTYVQKRDDDLATARKLVSHVVNGQDKSGIMKSIMLPVEFMITPIPKTATFRTIKDQLPLPNPATLIQTWETVTGVSSAADN